MVLPPVLDGIMSTADIKQYVKNNLTPSIIGHIKNLGQLDLLLRTYLHLKLEDKELEVIGGVFARYQQTGALNDKDASVMLRLIQKYRMQEPPVKFKKEFNE